MPARTRLSRSTTVLATAVGVTLAVGGVAAAAIPDAASRSISACYATSGGALRVIDPALGQTCRSTEKPLSWRTNGMVWRGAWATGVAYKIGDTVTRGGSTFVATVASTNNAPAPGSSVWAVLSPSPTAPTSGKTYYAQNQIPRQMQSDSPPLRVVQTNPVAAGRYLVTGKVWVSNPDPIREVRVYCGLGTAPLDKSFVNLAPAQNDTIVVQGIWDAPAADRAFVDCWSDQELNPATLNWGTLSAVPAPTADVSIIKPAPPQQ